MKNKLLITSALVGALAIAGSAVAETKISGSASYTYSFLGSDTVGAGHQGYGSEVQLDIANSGDLNVGGLKYKAGFSMEKDGSDTAGDWGEGNYFSVVSGKTEVMFNRDKAPNLSQSATPRVGQMLSTQAGSTANTVYVYAPGTLAKNSFNVALIQGTDMGTISLVHAPKNGDTGANNDKILADPLQTGGGSVTDIVYSGNLGVKGLSVVGGWSKHEKQTGAVSDTTAKQLGIGYNFGKFAVGVTRNKATTTTDVDTTSTDYGATYAVSDNMSVGILHGIGDKEAANANEKLTSATIGYNLGPATLEVYYLQLDNAGGSSTAKDQEKVAVRISTAF